MKDIEYSKMAYLYDKFYFNKNYNKEVEFIQKYIKNLDCKILDAGSGTGNHAKILNNWGYNIKGFDKSKEMVEIANSKIKNAFWVDDLLTVKTKEKFDLIISFFAVFNHLKSYKEFEIALTNLKSLLNKNGKIIIDLHNPLENGEKIEEIENVKRIMKWRKCNLLKKEYSNITYFIGGKKYTTSHVFKIFDIQKLEKIAKKLNFANVEFFDIYTQNVATKNSKNIQMILSI